jgi:hypothetical protein
VQYGPFTLEGVALGEVTEVETSKVRDFTDFLVMNRVTAEKKVTTLAKRSAKGPLQS